jgi:hypothetical protein
MSTPIPLNSDVPRCDRDTTRFYSVTSQMEGTMPSYRSAFPSKYLKAEDLGTTRPTGTIISVVLELVGNGADQARKLVVQFAEPTLKALVLNKINSETIARLAGTEDYSAWPGTRVQLFATTVEFQGKRQPCIRLCEPPGRPAPRVTPPSVRPIDERRPEPASDVAEYDVAPEIDPEIGI